jgi:excisionase family DNA binding protein
MKIEFENTDIEAIALRVVELLKPVLSNSSGQGTEDTILDVKGLADYLHTSKQWLYERTHLKEIPHIKIDGQLRFSKKAIDKWLQSFSVPAVKTHERILKAVR